MTLCQGQRDYQSRELAEQSARPTRSNNLKVPVPNRRQEMFTLAKAIIASGVLIYGAANIDPVPTTEDAALTSGQEIISTVFVFAPDHNAPDTFVRNGSEAEANMEQAAESLDDFAMQIPGVIVKKLQSVMKYGVKAVIMQDAETQPAEERMIGSLVGAIRGIGDAMAADMVQSAQNVHG